MDMHKRICIDTYLQVAVAAETISSVCKPQHTNERAGNQELLLCYKCCCSWCLQHCGWYCCCCCYSCRCCCCHKPFRIVYPRHLLLRLAGAVAVSPVPNQLALPLVMLLVLLLQQVASLVAAGLAPRKQQQQQEPSAAALAAVPAARRAPVWDRSPHPPERRPPQGGVYTPQESRQRPRLLQPLPYPLHCFRCLQKQKWQLLLLLQVQQQAQVLGRGGRCV